MDKRIGIVGLGIMGGAFARNLRPSGWSVIGYDIDGAAQCRGQGGGRGDRPQCRGRGRGRGRHHHQPAHAAGRAGYRRGDRPRRCAKGRTVVEASTLSLADKMAFKETLEAAGHTALDCPMSGTGAQAAVKDLVVYASGDAAAIARLEPAFLGFARKVFSLGAYGNGSKMKFVANHLVAIHNVAAAEAMVLAMKAGLDPHQTVEVVASGAGTSRVFELRAPMMAAGAYLPATMRSATWKKDLTVIGEFAADVGCPTPLFGLAAALHAAALAMGHGEEDTAAVCAVLEGMAGVERG